MVPQIQSVELARYRCFRDPQSLALGRLTLVYGENNSGKSALVRAPVLLARSRTPGNPGLDLDAPVLKRAAFRDIQWRGTLPTDADPDLTLGVTLSDGTTWRWTFRWMDLQALATVQRIEIETTFSKAIFERQPVSGASFRDVEYLGPNGTVRLALDGIVPRSGVEPNIDRHRDELNLVFDRVTWLGAMRLGPSREGFPRGARGSLAGDGEGASPLVLGDNVLRRAVSAWFRTHVACDVEVESLGAEMHRLVLQRTGPSHSVPFPDAGEGLQQAFPLVVALERLRLEGGLLTIEEPESHLHPRLQRALAELVVSVLAAQPSASVLLETHSEVFLVAALRAAARALSGDVQLHWVESQPDGAAVIEPIPLDIGARPTTPRLEVAFETMGVMRRELLTERRTAAAERASHGS